jgi:hypothetical protein
MLQQQPVDEDVAPAHFLYHPDVTLIALVCFDDRPKTKRPNFDQAGRWR